MSVQGGTSREGRAIVLGAAAVAFAILAAAGALADQLSRTSGNDLGAISWLLGGLTLVVVCLIAGLVVTRR
ncbi:MAG TPA: hypothetical protein VK646_05920 [Actinomycetota bacterium]|nr:hypothetical protein [Actinomycetota bacterium]